MLKFFSNKIILCVCVGGGANISCFTKDFGVIFSFYKSFYNFEENKKIFMREILKNTIFFILN